MKVDDHSFISMLEQTLQFTIPLYQRRYSWEKEQCKQLWKDIIALTKNEDKSITHFMGSLVDVSEVSSSTGIQKYCIVDGQQRLTTVMILLIALRDYCKKTFSTADKAYGLIKEILFKNTSEDDPDCWKLLLLSEDQLIFKDLIDNDGDNTKLIKKYSKSRLISNYQYFQNKLEHTKLDPKVLYRSIRNLNIVEITLTGNQENVQEIFESLNSTGKSLAQSDLIRNYILMNYPSDKQNYLYETYWKKLEQYFPDSSTREAAMDEFFRMYLSMNLRTFVSEKSIYDSFKELRSHPADDLSRNIHFDTVDDLCKDILLFIEWYLQITKQTNQTNPNEAIQSVYDGLNAMNTTTLIPLFLLLNYSCYETHAISETTCAYLMQLCITYVYRRKICGFSSSGYNKYFCGTLLSCLAQYTNEKDIIHALEEEFAEQVALGNLPSDQSFTNNFISANIYTIDKEFCSYTLCQLEDFNNKNHPGKLAHSIEHIMPQNPQLNQQWQKMLGENWKDIQLDFLHTPGNLTLTNYNSEMSDQSFKKKCEIDYQQSPFTHLNSDVRNCHTWTENQIRQRSKRLAALAVQVWAVPQVTEEIKDKAMLRNTRKKRSAASITDPLTVQEALNDTSMITSTLPKSLIFKDSNYSVKSWRQMLVTVFEALYNENPDIINQFVAENSQLIHTEAKAYNYYALGQTGFFISGKSAAATLKVIQKLLSFYDNEAGTDYCTTTKFTLK